MDGVVGTVNIVYSRNMLHLVKACVLYIYNRIRGIRVGPCLKKNQNAPRPSEFCFVIILSLELCNCFSDIFLPSIPRTLLPDWQRRILLGMVEARSANVKKTTPT